MKKQPFKIFVISLQASAEAYREAEFTFVYVVQDWPIIFVYLSIHCIQFIKLMWLAAGCYLLIL